MIDKNRISIKITGESGQGINAIGEVVAKAIKRCGFYTFGYREYPSLIKGGWASHQVDFSDHPINSSSSQCDIMLSFSRVSFHKYLTSLRQNGQAIHMLPMMQLSEDEQQQVLEKNLKIFYLPADDLAQKIGGMGIMANTVMLGALWKLLNLDVDPLTEVIKNEFFKKPEAIKPNLACLTKGYETNLDSLNQLEVHFSPNNNVKDDALLTGNHLVALGAIAAGVRAYFAYPMTPSSSILTYLAETYHETGMLVKQLDDEISVAQTAIGAMFMGTRALVATSGGGFDLMTESISLAAMTETPFVCILAQRPGPATGLPTWTSATDLNLAIYAGHGEYAKCVIAISDSASAYTSIQHAFNISEKYQIPTIVLTDKQIAESLFQLDRLPDAIEIKTHLVIGDNLKTLKSHDRYKITNSGISPRWLPGTSEATFVANSDEHYQDGSLAEESQPSKDMYLKRLRKIDTLLSELPEPELLGPQKAKLTFVGWGSVKNTICDVMNIWNEKHPNKSINFLHYEFIYPTKISQLKELIKKKQPLILIENNALGQLGALLTQLTGYQFQDKLLKFDGRPFFLEDITEYLTERFKL